MKLLMNSTGVKGHKPSNPKEVGEVRISVSDAVQIQHRIWIDNFSGCGDSYKKREQPLINIQFADGTIWAGTFEALQFRFDNRG